MNKDGDAVATMHGFIREAQRHETTYRGYRMTITSGSVIVHAQNGSTRAVFRSMVAARAFVRYLRSQ